MHSFRFIPLLSLLYTASVQADSSAWTINCGVLSIQRSDPIVSPGNASGHVHAISGGTAFSRTMNGVDAAVDAKQTTCDKFTDHSNYWSPQLYHMNPNGTFSLVPFTGTVVYYKNQTCSWRPDGECQPNPRDSHAFPPGFRMLAGDSSRRTYNDSDPTNQAIVYASGDYVPGQDVHGFPTVLPGKYFHADVRFPSCWDNKTVDSPNHKDHVAYPDPNLNQGIGGGSNTEGGMCPESHPVALISIGVEYWFDTDGAGVTDPKTLVWANGDTTGYGFHGDFIQGWTNLTALQDSFQNCFNTSYCPWNSFGTSDGIAPHPQNLNPEIPAVYEEEIGLQGPISKLPGNNPVYNPSSTVSTASTAVQIISTSGSSSSVAATDSTSTLSPSSATATTDAIASATTVYVTVAPVTKTVTSVISTCSV